MYFPFLRGKQNELIAIRDLNQQGIMSEQIVPVIEPIKYSSTLITTIEAFIESKKSLIVVINPVVGTFRNDLEENEGYFSQIIELFNSPFITIAYYMNGNSEEELPAIVQEFNVSLEEIAIIHHDISHLDIYETVFNDLKPKYNFIPSATEFRVRFTNLNAVLLTNPFVKRDRNADYYDIDEPFSSEHRYYLQQGFLGFSDYSIVGSEFLEGGFGAMAVALHIVYVDSQNNLRVRHFVSDSNEDRTDPAGKLSEALVKLAQWYSTTEDDQLNTVGLLTLLKHNEAGTSTSLGVVKRLSIMHHIELLDNILFPVTN
ncbi:sce7725 family protein [Jeotgalibacillus proteolyticus]|uniref:Sce7725 family protein n=1 Tax=Jeotgalibacillus proteolyticus TaxID=2082395 RepID=A0A2S5G7D9_9BACL|nr:sce7725 family protein [Jeotgalibacillus proteolyticus]PPA68875.1 hypothetical protein C4B60_18330 [Jeotgalibacillus proteolyticus]